MPEPTNSRSSKSEEPILKSHKDKIAEIRVTPQLILYSILHTCGLEFWIVSMGPFFIGWCISKESMILDWQIFIGVAIVGPLIGGFTFLFNEYFDKKSDMYNIRKITSALIVGLMDLNTIRAASIILLMAGLVLSLLFSLTFFLLILAMVILSILYSDPRTKLKGRGGMDLLVNILGLGVLCPLAGWSIYNPPLEFPPIYLFTIMMIIGGLYAPTTVADYDADKIAGYRTLAIVLGKKQTIILGFILLTLGCGTLILMGLFEIFPFKFEYLVWVWPALVLPPAIYAYSFRNIENLNFFWPLFLIFYIQGAGTFIFLLMFSFDWIPF
ncbi:MAG: UbiA prenyltransferase family protein [Thermoplasmata archaeon]|nr:MAG: UbiA prenyltransferase family protein [Thermoplasmata archaeon]